MIGNSDLPLPRNCTGWKQREGALILIHFWHLRLPHSLREVLPHNSSEKYPKIIDTE